MKAMLSWRRTRKTSTPSTAGRRSTTVEAGCAGWLIDTIYIVVARFLLAGGDKGRRNQMRRTAFFNAGLLFVSLSFACARPSQLTAVTEVGCLTATGDRFVLTSLESGERPATELYQLV